MRCSRLDFDHTTAQQSHTTGGKWDDRTSKLESDVAFLYCDLVTAVHAVSTGDHLTVAVPRSGGGQSERKGTTRFIVFERGRAPPIVLKDNS